MELYTPEVCVWDISLWMPSAFHSLLHSIYCHISRSLSSSPINLYLFCDIVPFAERVYISFPLFFHSHVLLSLDFLVKKKYTLVVSGNVNYQISQIQLSNILWFSDSILRITLEPKERPTFLIYMQLQTSHISPWCPIMLIR